MNTLYIHEEVVHNFAAPREVVPFLISLVKPTSVLDVGCGIGTWLKVFEENGITDYFGVDGDYVQRNMLKIPEAKFAAKDLRNDWSLDRKFDLVVCLEVAEHLPIENAERLVNSLISHGEVVLFSAAIPNQGGQNHLNEQWPEYWQAIFAKYGYHFHDVIRPHIWSNPNVDWWYKQNMFLVKKDVPGPMPFNALSVVHPELFNAHKAMEADYLKSLSVGRQGVNQAFKIFTKALLFKLKTTFGKGS